MKRITAVFLAAAMILSLAACTASQPATTAAATQAATPAATQAAAPAAPAETTAAPAPAKVDYPKRAVTLITHKSGSSADTCSRVFTPYLTETLGKNVVVQNSAGLVDAARDIINADPDGYSIGFLNDTVVINDVCGTTDFHSVDDFRMLAIIAEANSNWLFIKSDFAKANNINTYQDLVDYSKAHPGELKISDRLNSNTGFTCQSLLAEGLDAVPVDSDTGANRLTNFLSGAFDILLMNYGTCGQYVESGDFVCLMLCADHRSVVTPDLPCSKELGVNAGMPQVHYVCAPKDFPEEYVPIVQEAIKKACENGSSGVIVGEKHPQPQ